MKHLFTILTILTTVYAWGQDYIIDLRVKKIVYQGDSLVYEIPKTFETTTTQATQIIEIGTIGNKIFGVQIELIKSKLGQGDRFIAGRIYYIKKSRNADWEKLLTSPYSRVSVDELKNRVDEETRQKQIKEEKNEKVRQMYNSTDSDTMDEFGVYYYNYFYSKK